MRADRLISVAVIGLCLAACDDTGRAIRDEVKELDEQQVKRDLKAAAATVGSAAEKAVRKVDEGVKDVAKETEKVVDTIDKKAAEEIRDPEKR